MAAEIARVISEAAYQAYEKKLIREVLAGPVPKHLAIIMDGNRRFAEELGLSSADGHERGREKLEEVLEWCMDLDIRILTVYAFSTENLDRDDGELDDLMSLFAKNFRRVGDDKRVHENQIRIRVLGQTERLPPAVQEAIRYAEEKTADYDAYLFNLAMAYGGRQEILDAIRHLVEEAMEGSIALEDIDEGVFSKRLYTADLPDPDLILRTSGEERVSNFLLWQLAYSELYFVDVFWPGFRKIDFLRAIRSFQMRRRRFGS
jgi:tritrans,polycis-undecaprenyl-diphosphate synthase [geranylgeranyl-diphosphate specific]